jgi:hypothetical protein
MSQLTSTFGRFLFVAFSNARYDIDAYSLEPISTLNESPAFVPIIPITCSFRIGTYF